MGFSIDIHVYIHQNADELAEAEARIAELQNENILVKKTIEELQSKVTADTQSMEDAVDSAR